MKRIIAILFILLLFSGCTDRSAVHERQEGLCRSLCVDGFPKQYYDSIISLANDLPADARLEVLLEAIRSCKEPYYGGETMIWLKEARRIASRERMIEVEIEEQMRYYGNIPDTCSSATRDALKLKFYNLEKQYRLTSYQRTLFLYNKAMFRRNTDLLEVWMYLQEAGELVRGEKRPVLEVRILESFADVAQEGGDYKRAVSLWKEAYHLRGEEHFPLNRVRYLKILASYQSKQPLYPEAIRCWQELWGEARKQSDKTDERCAINQIIELYTLADSIPQALNILRQWEQSESLWNQRVIIWGKMGRLFEKKGVEDSVRFYYGKLVKEREKSVVDRVMFSEIPVYLSYARIMWKDGYREKAVKILQKCVHTIPRFSENNLTGGVFLYEYLQALSQLCEYYRIEGKMYPAMELLFRRDSLQKVYNESDRYHKKNKLVECFKNQDLQTKLQLQEKLLANRKLTLVILLLLCISLIGGLVMLWRLYRQKIRRLDEIYYKQKEVEKLKHLITGRSLPDTPETVLFRRIQKLMQEQQLFRNPNLTLDDLSLSAGSNRSYVSACINNVVGMNFSNWLNKIRVDFVIEMMGEGERNFMDIYTAAGFASQTSFYRNFKLLTQMTPRQYMQREEKNKK